MICICCQKDKPVSDFYANKNRKLRYSQPCKNCYSIKYKDKEAKEERQKKKQENKTLLTNGLKECSKCKQIKKVELFPKDKNQSSGYRPDCKECLAKYRQNGDVKARIKEYRKLDYVVARQKELRSTSISKKKLSEYQKEYLSRPGVKQKRKEYFQKEEVKANRRRYNKERMKNPKWRIASTASRAISKSLKYIGQTKRRRHWEDIVGYTKEELKSHLEKKFKLGMSCDNYGEWHIDHIIPISSFDITSVDCKELKRCWELSNLQPLWAADNIRKGNR